MKICCLASSFPRYKGDHYLLFVYEICKRLAKNNYVTVITPHDKETKSSEEMNGITIERFNYFFLKSLHRLAYGSGMAENVRNSLLAKIQVIPYLISFFLKAYKHVKNSDVIYAHVSVAGFVGVFLKKILNKPLIFHSYRIIKLNFINKFVLKNADHVIFISNYLKDKSGIKYGSVIPLGVDIEKFK